MNTTDLARLRDLMVDHQIAGRGVRSPLVLDAMRTVPREAFLPENLREFAYEDSPLPIEEDQTISQPYIVAMMIEALALAGGEKVLEIGTGSGYAAAVLAQIAGDVYTVERIGQLAEKSAATLADLGHRNVHVLHADGTLFDGDQLLYAIVKDRHAEGRLRGGVVGTLMTNFALEKRLAQMGIAFARTQVGDRYVLEKLLERGWECGGENSGHLLCLDCHTTGDAIISALQVLAALVASGRTLAEFTRELRLLPQVLVNVKVRGKLDLQAAPVREAVARAEADLAGGGRVLLRPSGTEPVVRVMVEGEDRAHVQELADAIAAVVKTATEPAAA